MFFTYPSLPLFETERHVMGAYPEWRLLFLEGWEENIYNFARQGIAEYVTYWKRYKANPAEVTFASIKEGLERIAEGQNIMIINEPQLLGHLKLNPTSQDLHVFGHHNFDRRCLIFHMNSPLLPMFDQGASYFREKGVEHELIAKWFGDGVNGDRSFQGNTLTIGQLGLVFIILAIIYALCLFVLCTEVMLQGSKRWMKQIGRKQDHR